MSILFLHVEARICRSTGISRCVPRMSTLADKVRLQPHSQGYLYSKNKRDRYECPIFALTCHLLPYPHTEEVRRLWSSSPLILPASTRWSLTISDCPTWFFHGWSPARKRSTRLFAYLRSSTHTQLGLLYVFAAGRRARFVKQTRAR